MILSFYFLISLNWAISITSPDEGRNAHVVLNMIKTKDFLVPYYNCHYRFEKPPMLYWLSVITSLFFGINEFSLRLVSGLSAVGIAVFLYLISRIFFEEALAWKALLIFLTLPHVWIEARSFTPEMLLNFFSIGGIYFFLREKPIIGWIFLGLAVLTKGPVGIILPFTVILFFRIFQKRFKIFDPLGIGLFLIIGTSWYLIMVYKFGFYYFYEFFLLENIFRYTGEKKFHPYPFYYYLIILLIVTFFYIPIYYKIFLKRKHLFISPLKPFLFWFLFVIIFYSISVNKLHHYILFAYPPLCVILAYFTTEKYLKTVLISSALFFLSLFLLVYFYYEKERFTNKAKDFLKIYRTDIYFYKCNLSSLVFYLETCIPNLENPKDFKKGFIITKKYKPNFNNCLKIIEAKEFNEDYILLYCHYK